MDPIAHLLVAALYIIFYPLLYLYPNLYYPIVNFGFEYVNFFRKKRVVPPVKDPLLLISATEAAEKIRRKELKSIDLIKAYIRRIKEVNPIINALVADCFEEAVEEAEKVDSFMESVSPESDEVRRLAEEKPLYGIPFTVKDSMDVKDRVITVGMVVRKGVISKDDAEVVKRTRQAGGILIGITNVPECLMAFETYNSIYGLTNNPYDSRRCPGGSSGGEGALVSACGSLIGIGSDIGGSVRIPAFHNGVYGLKATTDFVPPQGHLPEGFNGEGYRNKMFCVGPIARYIEDIPLCLKAFNPQGFRDNRIDEEVDIRNVKIFYMEGLPTDSGAEPLSEAQKEKLHEVVEFFEKEHKLNTQGISFLEMKDATDMLMTGVGDGSPAAHFICKDKNDLDGSKLLIEIVKSLFRLSDHFFNLLVMTYQGSINPHSEEEKEATFQRRDRLREKIIGVLERENAVLILPTWAHTPKYHGHAVWAFDDVAYTGIWNALSLPAFQCPTGLDHNGLPTGIQVVGVPNSEKLLLENELEGTKIIIEIEKALFRLSDHILNLLVLIYRGALNPPSEEEKDEIFQKIEKLRQKIIGILERENAVLLLPTWAHTPAFHGYALWTNENVAYTGVWNALSLPVFQCPTGLDDNGLPTGIQIVGAPNSERMLLGVGKQIGGLFGGWQAPWAKGI